jgi:hypothetical protein
MAGKALEVCDQGSFFVGGVPKVTRFAASAKTEGALEQTIVGQAYVQFQIPKQRRRWPLVLVHGLSHTGASLEATPDGREGWLPYAVAHDFATFVMDQPGRGRSGFDASAINEARATGRTESMPAITRITDNGAWTLWFGHQVPAGYSIVDGRLIRHGDPGDPDPAEDPGKPSEAHGKYPPAFPIPPIPYSIDPKIAARAGAIGPAPDPANNTNLALQYFKQLVPNGEETLPGSLCASCEPKEVAPSETWSPRAMADLLEGLGGAIVAAHSQSSIQAMHMVRILKERGELHLLKGLIIPEGAAPLKAAGLTPSDMDHIPFLIVMGDYRPVGRPVAGRLANRADVAAMNASPTRDVGPALAIDLDDPRFGTEFQGQTHMNMLGTTSLKLFDFIMEWANKNIPNSLVSSGCE